MSTTTPRATGLFEQIRAFDHVFWICIFMELMERMAYYGVRLVVPVYMVLASSEGGPGLTHTEKGTILAFWAAMQSWLPTFAGGFSDRYGYKRTIALSVVLKTAGYAGMAMAGDFWGMLIGTQLLAAGTGLFKPGIQGTMAHSIAKAPGTESMGWGLFYQSVNVGAAVAAYIPAFARDAWGWHGVFWVCSAIVCSNFIPLFFYQDPKDERQAHTDQRSPLALVGESLRELFTSPVLLGFIFISAGFWFTFHQLFDMLPNYVDDWTDSSGLLGLLGQTFGVQAWIDEAAQGVNIPQERLLNINAQMIMFTMFIFAWLSSKMRVLTSSVVGMGIASLALLLLIGSANVGAVLGAVVIFTIGEMLASPKRQEYMSSLAPPGKRALYLGYANMPDGIGWVLGSLIAGATYEEKGDKINLARKLLAEQADAADVAAFVADAKAYDAGLQKELLGHAADAFGAAPASYDAALSQLASAPNAPALMAELAPRGEVLDLVMRAVPTLPNGATTTAATLRDHLFATYNPGQVWITFLVMGGLSTILMVFYDRWAHARKMAEARGSAAN